MPEGHSVHRIARQFERGFLGQPLTVTSPQGRFAAGAAQLDGRAMTSVRAVGKQMFAEFDHGLWLRVHLGMYGAWDFAGDIRVDATTASALGRMGQTNQRGTVLADTVVSAVGAGQDGELEDSLASIGAPRRLRMAESERLGEAIEGFPPEPVGQVRVRLLTETAVVDLRGPTACEVLTIEQVHAVIDKLGPDPLVDDPGQGEARFLDAVARRRVAIALLLMDQAVVSGIGNVYRAEMLFRARLDPFRVGRELSEAVVRALWQDWSRLLAIGVETGQMLTMDDLDPEAYRRALASRADRHWVYHRTGLPCRVCGTSVLMRELGGRKLYWCPDCQS